MCGIFGVVASHKSVLTKQGNANITNKLFILSEARGKESSGMSVKNTADNKISIYKKPLAASDLIKTNGFKDFYQESLTNLFDPQTNKVIHSFALTAHARLVTNGTQENNNNNQPCIKAGGVCIHNGIITNTDALWEKYKHLDRLYEVDTEVLLSIIRNKFVPQEDNLIQAIQLGFSEIEGAASIVLQNEDSDKIALATNTGSLYYSISEDKSILLFASERYILGATISELNLKATLGMNDILWLESGTGFTLDINSFQIEKFSLKQISENLLHLDTCDITPTTRNVIKNFTPDKAINIAEISQPRFHIGKSVLHNKLKFDANAFHKLKRCTKCILPETFPYISFDNNGVCSYCNSYTTRDNSVKEEQIKKIADSYRGGNGQYDCIVPFSGGRDSSYGLHYIVNELKMKPLTFTYDWGMVTDLARRNIARLCGKLGVENIIVSADIHAKRKYIRKNVEAWLKKPDLGIIPLFMAGDKYFFYYLNQLKKQTGLKLNLWMTNHLEDTNFKTGYCNIKPDFNKELIDQLSRKQQLQLIWYYGKNYFLNPNYLNSSLIDTIGAFKAYYIEPRTDYFLLFDWIKWDEKLIENTLIQEYNWELSPDTTSSWRIGDGTAAFYNYIYFTVSGFSEVDTFRSNQVREGMITREQALKYSFDENQPRYESLKWYLDIIDIDFERAIDIINKIPKRYQME